MSVNEGLEAGVSVYCVQCGVRFENPPLTSESTDGRFDGVESDAY